MEYRREIVCVCVCDVCLNPFIDIIIINNFYYFVECIAIIRHHGTSRLHLSVA